MTSSERPGGTVSDSISVTKPYLYGWRTWVSIPLLIGAPEVLCASQVAEIWPWRRRILQELLGIVNQAPGCVLVDVPIHLPDEALVILRRVEIVDDCRVVDRHGDEIRLMGGEHCPRAVPGGGRAGRELREDGLIPDHRLPALLGEARDDGGRPGPPMRLEQALEGGEAYVRQVHRPRHDPGGTNRLEGGEGGRSDPIAWLVRSGFSTMTHSWVAREGRTRAASGPSTTTRDFTSSASSASRMRTTKGRPRKSKSALGLPIRSEAPAASTTPARPMQLRYRELHPAAKPPNWRPMAVRRIRQLGDPILRVRCERVQNPKSAATRLVADDLRDSLAIARKKYKMGRALAAPQIGAPVRIVFVQMDKQRWTMINPEITDVGRDDFLVWDDCFSSVISGLI